jgi:hypothetical protein
VYTECPGRDDGCLCMKSKRRPPPTSANTGILICVITKSCRDVTHNVNVTSITFSIHKRTAAARKRHFVCVMRHNVTSRRHMRHIVTSSHASQCDVPRHMRHNVTSRRHMRHNVTSRNHNVTSHCDVITNIGAKRHFLCAGIVMSQRHIMTSRTRSGTLCARPLRMACGTGAAATL